VAAPADTARYDVLIVGGMVLDGTGRSAQRLDVAIRGDRVVAMAPALTRSRATLVVNAAARIVSPGFIDLHAHLEPLLQLPLAESALRQGVTLALGGPDGGSPLPLAPYLDSVRTKTVGINVAYLVGHNDIRRRVMGMSDKAPTADQLQRMRLLVAQAMHDGAFGLSTGLLYLPGTYSKVDEVVALAQAASDSGGIYTSHLRKEGIGLLDGVGEALEIGRRAKIPVVLTHHKVVGQVMWGKSAVTLAMVDSARKAGTDVMIDQYPYTATHTGIGVLVPSWAMAGGDSAFARRLANPALKDSITRGIVDNILNDRGGGDLSRVQFSRVPWDKTLEGKTLKDWAARRQLAPTPENGALLVLEAMKNGGGNAIYHVLDEQDVRRIMVHPQTMIASDGRLSQPGDGHPHPRAYGTFPRVLGAYVRKQQLMPLETAVHKMTGMPAARLGLADRGVLRVGAYADVVVFDARTVKDQSTFAAPHQYPVGIETVIVNGVVAVKGGVPTGARVGRVLTHASSAITALRFKALVDPGGTSTPDAVVLVQGDTIVRVGRGAGAIPAGARVVDLRRYTAIPGLIDVHTHMTYWRDKSNPTAPLPRARDSVVMMAAQNARKTLETGVTTVRDLGASNYTDIAMRDAINSGAMVGPRMFVSGYGLSKVAAPRAGAAPAADAPSPALRGRVQDSTEIVQAITAQVEAGADWIKMYGSTGSFQVVTGTQTFTDAEMRVAATTAHRLGKPIAIHSYGDSGGRAAMRAGAESVEHPAMLNDATLAEFARRGTVYVPTIDHNRFYADNASPLGYNREQVAGLDSFRLLNLATARRAHAAGVPFAMGSDAVYWMFGENTRELAWFVKAGMSPAQALATATTNGAKLLRMPNKIGRVAPGFFADIVAVDGDPLRDIDVVIHRVVWVMKGGATVVDKR